jgi:hypothetical protein
MSLTNKFDIPKCHNHRGLQNERKFGNADAQGEANRENDEGDEGDNDFTHDMANMTLEEKEKAIAEIMELLEGATADRALSNLYQELDEEPNDPPQKKVGRDKKQRRKKGRGAPGKKEDSVTVTPAIVAVEEVEEKEEISGEMPAKVGQAKPPSHEDIAVEGGSEVEVLRQGLRYCRGSKNMATPLNGTPAHDCPPEVPPVRKFIDGEWLTEETLFVRLHAELAQQKEYCTNAQLLVRTRDLELQALTEKLNSKDVAEARCVERLVEAEREIVEAEADNTRLLTILERKVIQVRELNRKNEQTIARVRAEGADLLSETQQQLQAAFDLKQAEARCETVKLREELVKVRVAAKKSEAQLQAALKVVSAEKEVMLRAPLIYAWSCWNTTHMAVASVLPTAFSIQ